MFVEISNRKTKGNKLFFLLENIFGIDSFLYTVEGNV